MSADSHASTRSQLIALSQALGQEHRELAILGEGNTSAHTGESTISQEVPSHFTQLPHPNE